MNIDFDLYKIFISVANNKSFSKAAKELFITQPAVSHNIKNLEDALECKLFERSGNNVILTKKGSELYLLINKNVQALTNVSSFLKTNSKGCELKISTSPLICKMIIQNTIKDLTKYYDKIEVESLLNDREKLISLEQGDCDFVVIKDYGLPIAKTLESRVIKTLNYCFFVNKSVEGEIEDLFNRNLIFKNTKTKGRKLFNTKLQNIVNEFNKTIEVSHDELVIDFVSNNLGVGYAPKEYLDKSFRVLNYKTNISQNLLLVFRKESLLDSNFSKIVENI